jgi:hypothetical protein
VDGKRQHPDRDRTADRHAVLPVLRLAVGQDRPQADHPRRLPDRGADVLPAVQGAHALREPALERATQKAPITVLADPATCSFQFNPVGTSKFTSSCDIAKSALAKAGLNYENVAAPAGDGADQAATR